MIDYLDEDVAYLLGLIVSRGKLIDAVPLRSLVIEFPVTRLHAPTAKAPHPQEQHKRLPNVLRGKHFESYWEICLALGCRQGHPASNEEVASGSEA